ncbi:antitoxin VbhA family protein [Microvirga sp. RSM25]|uniref:antitoxin VbhA family protein n=1 Tax=Microvirga sp. RSM25 TaxID=3273802 RepID=UPI00384B4114
MTKDEDPDGPKDLMRNPEITRLIQQLADEGMGLPAIEGLIKDALRDKLDEPTAPADPPGGYSAEAISVLEGLLPKRPWKLLATGEGSLALTSEVTRSIEEIFELFPSVSFLTLQTAWGEGLVVRDYPSGYTQRVDRLLANIFKQNSAITGIIFPAREGQPAHTATPEHPFWSAEGQIRVERVRAFLKEIAVKKAGTPRTPPEEVERRRKIVEAAHHNNLMAGIERDPTTDPIFEAFISGDIDITDILPAFRSLDTDTE